MRAPLKRSLILICLLSGLGAWCQDQIAFRQLSIKDGLSQNSAISVTQDSTGFLWIATQDGLNRYDGTEFVKYPFIFTDITRPTFSHLGKVYADRVGGVWCIADPGVLHRYDPGSDRFIAIPWFKDASIIYQDRDQRYWVGTYQGELHSFNNAENASDGDLRILTSAPVNDLHESGEGLLAATGKGIYVIDRENGRVRDSLRHTASGRVVNRGFSTISIDKNGREWFGTYGRGLYFREPGERMLREAGSLDFARGLPSDLNILSLQADARGRLWVGTYGDGLFLLDATIGEPRQFKADKHNPRAIHYNDILGIAEDNTGTLWFGTDGAGLSYYDPYLEKFNSVVNSQAPVEINVDVVRAVERDTLGSVWIGTSGKGLMRYELATDSWEKYSAAATGLRSDRIMSLYHDGSALWVGTQGGGLSLLDAQGRVTNYTGQPGYGLEAITIWDIYRDRKGRTWLGTREFGLLQFDLREGVVRRIEASVTPETPVFENVRTIAEGINGELWLGGDTEGLIRLHPDTGAFKAYRANGEPDALPTDRIKSLHFAVDGRLWIGTNGSGLSVLDPDTGHFQTYSEADGLANDVIYGILPGSNRDLWLSSNRGITRFTPAGSESDIPEIANYSNYEGLPTEFNTGAYYRHRDGTLFFGGLEGIYWFRPDDIENNPHLPRTTITGMRVSNQIQAMSTGLELNHWENSVSFTFTGMQFALPEEIEYRYRLLNYDEAWVNAGHANFARYSFLPPGDYEFQVQASNYDGVWNPEPAAFAFSIAPPWYATSWAKFLYIAFFVLGAVGIYLYLKFRWRMKLNLQLKEAETERLQRLNDFKSKLYTDISHEFRTPLSLIAAPVEARLKSGGLNDKEYSQMAMINRNTNRLITLVDQMLHLARLEKGKLTLHPQEGDLGLFLRVLIRSFEFQASQARVDLRWEVADTGMRWYDPDVLEKIVSNLLSNAIKYSPPGGTCNLETAMVSDRLQLKIGNSVADSADLDLEQLFTRFYQGDDRREGAGVGLALVKELTEFCHGRINAHLENDTLIFELEIPTDPSVLAGARAQDVREEQPPVPAIPEANRKEEPNLIEDLPIVLVVEDHPEVLEFLETSWQRKYRVMTATDGQAGLKAARQHVPDLVLTDIRMPGMTGTELCNRIKTDESTSHIPVVLLTSGTGMDQELQGLESGADDFVTKPFKLEVLEKRIDNLIRTRRALRERYAQQTVLEAKDIAVTPTDEVFLNRVRRILDSRLSDAGFNAAGFAREVGMSRMQLHRKLQTYTGLSTSAFIRSQRLKQAAHLLRDSDLSVNEVAYSVGFNTPSYFIKCFREAYGQTPAHYVQNTL